MSAFRWNATVVDSPGSEPWAVVGDLVVAVRTPRSRDFVTVEVAPSARCGPPVHQRDPLLAPAPYPHLTDQWQGEVRLGHTIGFSVAGESYRLTLADLDESPAGPPWITCQFCIERD